MAKQNPIIKRVQALEEGVTHRLEILEEQMRQLLSASEVHNGTGNTQQQEQDELHRTRRELKREKALRLELEEKLKKNEQKMKHQYQEIVGMFEKVDLDKEKYLVAAASCGNTAQVQLLLDIGADPETDGPLHLAAQAGHVDVVRLLVDFGANVNVTDTSKCTPLHLAAGNGHTETCRVLIDGKARVNKVNTDGRTPLHTSAEKGHPDICQLLILAGASVNVLNNDKLSPLHCAARYNHTDICQLLIDSKCNINQCSSGNNNTPLHEAAGYGSLSAVRRLVQCGADTSIKNKFGDTALYSAAFLGKTDVVTYLKQLTTKRNE